MLKVNTFSTEYNLVSEAEVPVGIAAKAAKSELPGHDSSDGHRPISRSVLREINALLGGLASASHENRKSRLRKYSPLVLASLSASNNLSEQEALDRLFPVAKSIGIDIAEISLTVSAGLKDGKDKPRSPAAGVFEILDHTPESIDRPIRSIGNHAYGVTWLPVGAGKSDQRPMIERVVIRDDRAFFCGRDIPGSRPLEELDLFVDVELELPVSKRLSPLGFKRFISGKGAAPDDVFERVVQSIDTFVSFDDSSNEQQSMCELVACWTVGTYFGDAFDVLGYLWPNGERGSGKTQLLNAIHHIGLPRKDDYRRKQLRRDQRRGELRSHNSV